MARQFRPERVEYDVLTAHPDPAEAAAGVTQWATAAVDAVDPAPLNGMDALKDYVLAMLPRLRDFAEHVTAPRGEAHAPALRYGAYLSVRAMVRDKSGQALAELHADGRALLPGELDADLRGRVNGLVNVGLPMATRAVDQGSYESALESLVKARSVVNAMLQAVLNMAVSGPEPVSRERLAAALRVQPADLDSWYAGRTS
ncbi:hypothetical protein ABIA35_005480 [Catenulispora sp. MAP12-49]|jgi:hypothetical protein|uniref:hypothetical protein n=1 Tax=unclassified Catenulispora TaxID=414885 RepID=UPI0035139CBF